MHPMWVFAGFLKLHLSTTRDVSRDRGIGTPKSQRLEELEGQFLSLENTITLSDDEQGMYNPLLRKVFRFHYHSQKVIGSLGFHVFFAG